MKKLLIFVALCIAYVSSQANPEASVLFEKGHAYYEQDKYDLAIPPLEEAIKLSPDNAIYHHILAKSYGREAEKSNWFKAMSLAKKTLKHLEIAVNLDKENVQYLDDLKDYYREAPGFLGGNEKKANEIEALIKKLTHKNDQISDSIEKIE